MNTPAHLVISGLVLGRGRFAKHWLAITTGALLPDLPMVGFYAYQRLVAAAPDRLIWSELYFQESWQVFFDVFNSLPLIAIGLAIAWARGSTAAIALFASMGLHALGDLPLHREDAHAHFYPFSSWRFMSPISYWDPRFHGGIFALFEVALVIVGSRVLVRRSRAWRAIGWTTLAVYVLFGVFALAMWVKP